MALCADLAHRLYVADLEARSLNFKKLLYRNTNKIIHILVSKDTVLK